MKKEDVIKHQNRIPSEHAKIAIALRLCSENAHRTSHKCKKADRCQPRLMVTPIQNHMFLKNSGVTLHRLRGQLVAILGNAGAILAPSWEDLGLLGHTLGLDHQAWKAKTFSKASLEHSIAAYAYKTNAFLMVLKWHLSSIIENTCTTEMPTSLSPYACAAKTLTGHHTSAKRLIGVSRD